MNMERKIEEFFKVFFGNLRFFFWSSEKFFFERKRPTLDKFHILLPNSFFKSYDIINIPV